MERLKRISKAITAVILACSLCGCKVEFGSDSEESSDMFVEAVVNNGIEPRSDTIVARAKNGGGQEFGITYEEFRKEYMYFLVNSGISDDNDALAASRCQSQRETLINSLVTEQIIIAKAKELGLYELTEEEQRAVSEDYDSKIAEQIAYYGQQASLSDSSMTDEEKETFGNLQLDNMLSACGMTRDDLKWWATSSKISEKLKEELGKSVTRAQAEKEFKELQEHAEELYKSDVSNYEQQGFARVWLPEGSRLIKHVLLGFDSDTQTEIKNLRADGKTDEANKLREEKAKELKSKQDEVEKKLENGENIEDLIKEYSADAEGSAQSPEGYTVFPNGTTYVAEFQQAAFVPKKIGERTVCVTDFGVHIMLYVGNASVSSENIKYYTDYIEEQLKYQAFSEKISEWRGEYDFEINFEALRINEPTEGSSE